MSLFLFNTVLTPAAFTLPNNAELPTLALGGTTIVNCTSTQSLNFTGMVAVGGNIDGMVVCLSNVNNNSFSLSFTHEDLTAVASHRFRNAGGSTVGGSTGAGAVWYRYNGTVQRWIHLAKT